MSNFTKLFCYLGLKIKYCAGSVEPLEINTSDISKECCEKSLEDGGKKCCKSTILEKNPQLINSDVSQVQLAVVPNSPNQITTRHHARFGITSFIYRARRPFHPGRFYNQFMEQYFMLRFPEFEDSDSASQVNLLQMQASAKVCSL